MVQVKVNSERRSMEGDAEAYEALRMPKNLHVAWIPCTECGASFPFRSGIEGRTVPVLPIDHVCMACLSGWMQAWEAAHDWLVPDDYR